MPAFFNFTIGDYTIANWVYFVVLSLVFIVGLLTAVAYTTLFERKVISLMQVRKGPNRAGPLGLLQPLADGIKLFFKEDTIPATADGFLHRLAPGISVFAAMAAFCLVELGVVFEFL
jgi:NADH-quinone oxidoreductase subunit H